MSIVTASKIALTFHFTHNSLRHLLKDDKHTNVSNNKNKITRKRKNIKSKLRHEGGNEFLRVLSNTTLLAGYSNTGETQNARTCETEK